MKEYLNGDIDQSEVFQFGAEIKKRNWSIQQEIGIDYIPSNDFSYLNRLLDLSVLLGAVPERFLSSEGQLDFDHFLAMQYGRDNLAPLEKRTWVNTKYQYTAPEIKKNQEFSLSGTKVFDDYLEAKSLGIQTKPVLLGPLTYLLSSVKQGDFDPLSLLDSILPVYAEILARLNELGADWVQIDEPAITAHQSKDVSEAIDRAYKFLSKEVDINIMFTVFLSGLKDHLKTVCALPVKGLHVDMIHASDELAYILDNDHGKILSLGVVDGQSVLKTDIAKQLKIVERVTKNIGLRRVIIAPNCSLSYLPADLEDEKNLDENVRELFSYARQKLKDIKIMADALNVGKHVVFEALKKNEDLMKDIADHDRLTDSRVQSHLKRIQDTGEY